MDSFGGEMICTYRATENCVEEDSTGPTISAQTMPLDSWGLAMATMSFFQVGSDGGLFGIVSILRNPDGYVGISDLSEPVVTKNEGVNKEAIPTVCC